MSIVAIGEAMVTRLVATVEAANLVKAVYSHTDYAALPELSMLTPSLAVIYNGYTPEQTSHEGSVQNVGFNFLVVVNVRNARNPGTGAGVRDDASPVFDAVMDALLGWRPIPKFRPLRLAPAPGAALSDAGFGYFPLSFSTVGTYRGQPAT